MRFWARKMQRLLGLRELDLPENRTLLRVATATSAAAILLRLLFWVYTHRYWDDALIACLHTENAAQGLGLCHAVSADAPVQGFTSPLTILISLAADLLRPGLGIELIKLASILAAALSVFYVLALGLLPKLRLAAPLLCVAMAYVALEHHQILWGMAGMETQFAVLALLASAYYTVTLQPVRLGVALGLCMLVRPDFALWTVIAGFYVLCRQPRAFLAVAGTALALYLPWVIFSSVYYGSPIPHTIAAKSAGFGWPWPDGEPLTFFALKRHVWVTLAEHLFIHLGPVFGGHGAGIHKFFTSGPESPIANGVFCLAVVGAVVGLLKREWERWPLIAFVALYSLYYVFLVPILYGWYKMPYTIAMLLVALWGLHWGAQFVAKEPLRHRFLAIVGVLYIGSFLVVLPRCFYAERMIQEHIDNGIRRAAGEYLNEHMSEDETVATEALGYIAYYSRRNVHDWPGLASRKVVDWSQAQAPEDRTLENMCKALKPDYLFLRDLEVRYYFDSMDWLEADYHVVKVFNVGPEVRDRIPWVESSIDQVFRLYKRKRPDDNTPHDDNLFPRRP